MNIFYLDHNVEKCVQEYVDRHTIKMILESSQLLETAFIHQNIETPYSTGKIGWVNHPCAKWVRESRDNYLWLCDLGDALLAEYTYRYGKVHSYSDRFTWYRKNVPVLPEVGFTKPYLAMPEDCHQVDAVEAYRDYYRKYKGHLAAWKKRAVPKWYGDNLNG